MQKKTQKKRNPSIYLQAVGVLHNTYFLLFSSALYQLRRFPKFPLGNLRKESTDIKCLVVSNVCTSSSHHSVSYCLCIALPNTPSQSFPNHLTDLGVCLMEQPISVYGINRSSPDQYITIHSQLLKQREKGRGVIWYYISPRAHHSNIASCEQLFSVCGHYMSTLRMPGKLII